MWDWHPTWSPDGTQIVFDSFTDGIIGQPDREIYVMNADGTNQTQITNNAVVDAHAAWSPDLLAIAAALPGISRFGMLVLALMLAAASFWILRRQRATAREGT